MSNSSTSTTPRASSTATSSAQAIEAPSNNEAPTTERVAILKAIQNPKGRPSKKCKNSDNLSREQVAKAAGFTNHQAAHQATQVEAVEILDQIMEKFQVLKGLLAED